MEWHQVSMTWREFRNSEFCKPGTIVTVKNYNKKWKDYLIGDININGGVCDDCMNFEYEAKVKRYKV